MWNAQSHQIWQKSRPVASNLASDSWLATLPPEGTAHMAVPYSYRPEGGLSDDDMRRKASSILTATIVPKATRRTGASGSRCKNRLRPLLPLSKCRNTLALAPSFEAYKFLRVAAFREGMAMARRGGSPPRRQRLNLIKCSLEQAEKQI
jgi:hypothetical protein